MTILFEEGGPYPRDNSDNFAFSFDLEHNMPHSFFFLHHIEHVDIAGFWCSDPITKYADSNILFWAALPSVFMQDLSPSGGVRSALGVLSVSRLFASLQGLLFGLHRGEMLIAPVLPHTIFQVAHTAHLSPGLIFMFNTAWLTGRDSRLTANEPSRNRVYC